MRRQVVDLVRLHLLDDADQVGRVGQVAVMEDEIAVLHVRILVEMVDAVGVEEGGAALDAVDDIALLQQELGQIGAVLAGNAGDECDFCGHGKGPFFRGGQIRSKGPLLPRGWQEKKYLALSRSRQWSPCTLGEL